MKRPIRLPKSLRPPEPEETLEQMEAQLQKQKEYQREYYLKHGKKGGGDYLKRLLAKRDALGPGYWNEVLENVRRIKVERERLVWEGKP
jgi:hypothetical protein